LNYHVLLLHSGARNEEELLSLAVYARHNINPLLFNYALSVALIKRADTSTLKIPPLFKVFPSKFIDTQTLAEARQKARITPSEMGKKIIVKQARTGNDLDPEHR
jgi:hypothetical protein